MRNQLARARSIISALAALMILLAAVSFSGQAAGAPLTQPLAQNPQAAAPLPAPTITEVGAHSQQVMLGWKTIAGAIKYNVYRSLTSGAGYVKVGEAMSIPSLPNTNFWDTRLTNGTRYYYVVTAVDNAGTESWYSNEMMVVPHIGIGWAGQVSPAEMNIEIGSTTRTQPIYAEVFIDSKTGPEGPATKIGLIAQVGIGPLGTAPALWTNWTNAVYDGPSTMRPANDRYKAQPVLPAPGLYNYVYRFSMTGGASWVYADRFSLIVDPSKPVPDLPENNVDGPGLLVIAGPDDPPGPPAAPANLVVVGAPQFRSVSLSWSAVNVDDLFGYEIFRAPCETVATAGTFVPVGKIVSIKTSQVTNFTDTTAVAGSKYCYRVRAFDFHYNASGDSNTVQAVTPSRPVSVTVKVNVPAYTPGTVHFSLCQTVTNGICQSWNPSSVAMTKSGSVWTASLFLQDGTPLSLYFHRGNPQTTGQAQSDGDTLPALTPVIVDYGTSGAQEISFLVVNWRDPIVVNYTPRGEGKVSPGIPFTITWNQPMPENTTFVVRDGAGQLLNGKFIYNPNTYTVTFVPDKGVAIESTYSFEVSGTKDRVGDVQQVPLTWTVTTGTFTIWMPGIHK